MAGDGAAAPRTLDVLAKFETLCPSEFDRLRQLKEDSKQRVAKRASHAAQLAAQQHALLALQVRISRLSWAPAALQAHGTPRARQRALSVRGLV